MAGGSASPVIRELLERNRLWVLGRLEEDPGFFARLARGQEPQVLFIGCCDSRKCLNTMTGTLPGELFIHRNIANQAPPDDPNVQAVLEYAIQHLKVRHVIVAGHTRCGGVTAALEGHSAGMLGGWLEPLRALAARHAPELEAIAGMRERADRLAELNVVAQVGNVRRCAAYVEGRSRGTAPEVHGWMFLLETGHIREVEIPAGG
jgi:carbonic anhydrase